MADFRKQLLEDFDDYRLRYPNISNLSKDEWAFNFWILDNLFSVDEDIIETNIVDYNDKGVDCFVWHEDLHDLYLIQNKFYSDGTKVSVDYIQNDFLTRSIGALEKGTYTRSKELQDIFNKFSGEDDFNVHFHLYVTNNSSKTDAVINSLANFNALYADKRYDAKIFSLDDIQELYFQEPIEDKKSFKYTIQTINKGTILNVDNEAYKMTLALDAKYVLTPVTVIYNMYKSAKEKRYPLFDENIREYLGSTGAVNKKIVATLKNPNDRANFFFYNNGITMIVSDMSGESISPTTQKRVFDVFDPQIVNGCQTVSTIFEALSSLPESTLEAEFSDTFVMIKILKIPADNEGLKTLYKNIVTYNNSQNSINEKTFIAIQDVFRHVQREFEWRGLLVCIKQSDKNTFSEKYKTATPLLNNCKEKLDLFGIEGYSKTKDFFVDLEKLLQVVLAFANQPLDAIQNKAKLLKDQTIQNRTVVDFIKNPQYTTNDLFDLYLLYLRADQEKKNGDGRVPNPFYFLFCFARYECKDSVYTIDQILKDSDTVDALVKKYKLVLTRYYTQWAKNNPGKEYNDMIKSSVDVALLDECKTDAEQLMQLL